MARFWFCVIAAGVIVLLGYPLAAKQFHRTALRSAAYSPSDIISDILGSDSRRDFKASESRARAPLWRAKIEKGGAL